MQLQGSRADPAQLERLQSMLSEKNGEIQSLTSKLQRLENMEVGGLITMTSTAVHSKDECKTFSHRLVVFTRYVQ